jgi:hypothetical protein
MTKQAINASQLSHPSLRAKIERAIRSLSGANNGAAAVLNRRGKAVLIVSKRGTSFRYSCVKSRQDVTGQLYKAFRSC